MKINYVNYSTHIFDYVRKFLRFTTKKNSSIIMTFVADLSANLQVTHTFMTIKKQIVSIFM